MGRIVEPRSSSGNMLADAPRDDYLSRVAKYIPSEFIAIYLTLDKITKPEGLWSALEPNTKTTALQQGALVFGVLLIANAAYFVWQARREKKPYLLHTSISTAAFILWAYALPGTLFEPISSAQWSSVLLILFSFLAGIFEPTRKN